MHAADTPLGQPTHYADNYDPGQLCPIPRKLARVGLGLDSSLPFVGVDIWNAYEFSWLDQRGKPEIAVLELRFDAISPRIVESKSLKLYLGGFAGERMPGRDTLIGTLKRDLDQASGKDVGVHLLPAAQVRREDFADLAGTVIDDADIDIARYGPPHPDFLRASSDEAVSEHLVSHLLKSNCPVTGQPDWASVQIGYAGPRIDRAGLLRYLVSYREHSGFHEDCVERIFLDITERCSPTRLSVYARYTRRGGIDINPWRSSDQGRPDGNRRTARQ